MADTTPTPVEIDQETLELMALTAWTVARPGGHEGFLAFMRERPEWEGLPTETRRALVLAVDKTAGLVAHKGDDAPAFVARLVRRAGLDLAL